MKFLRRLVFSECAASGLETIQEILEVGCLARSKLFDLAESFLHAGFTVVLLPSPSSASVAVGNQMKMKLVVSLHEHSINQTEKAGLQE